MSNADLIEQAREAIDNMDDFARMANVVATGPLLVLNRSIDALEAADKRIAELAKFHAELHVEHGKAKIRIGELERKLAVAREALESCGVNHGLTGPQQHYDESLVDTALAQIGGEDASS